MSDTIDLKTNDDVEYIKVGNTVYEVSSFYDGTISIAELIKTALKRDAQTVLRQLDNP